ncbi:SCO4225 family membrane protein [Streptomyces sp. NPDC048202]|uniref:SCO4225 family membrane protein n=1 Tax=Streptomyces sp. NPDC048202 TaxID=3365514 RepID=UPI003719B759
MASTTRPRSGRLRAWLTLATDNWLSCGYLVVAGSALGFFLYAVYLSPDPGFAAIWPFAVTLPLSAVAFLAPSPELDPAVDWLTPLLFAAWIALCALANAGLLGMAVRAFRTRSAA